MKNDKFVVDGFIFNSEEEYRAALNEKKGVEYMRGKTNLNNVNSVLEIYDKIIEKDLFKTPVGYCFLKELHDILVKSSIIDNDNVKNIKVVESGSKKLIESNKQLKEKLKNVSTLYKNRFFNSVILNIILVIIIVLIMVITSNSENVNILNYKDRIDAEYMDREDALAAWEEELKIREDSLEE